VHLRCCCARQAAPELAHTRLQACIRLRLRSAPCALLQTSMRMLQVVITGKRGDVATEALVDAAHSVFAPDKVSVLKAYLEPLWACR